MRLSKKLGQLLKITLLKSHCFFFTKVGTPFEITKGMKNPNHQNKDKLEFLLERYQKEEQEFQNHPLWRQLKTTPQEFFKRVNRYVEESGMDPRVWQQKLTEAKKTIETRMMEQTGQYDKVNFKNIKGLRV